MLEEHPSLVDLALAWPLQEKLRVADLIGPALELLSIGTPKSKTRDTAADYCHRLAMTKLGLYHGEVRRRQLLDDSDHGKLQELASRVAAEWRELAEALGGVPWAAPLSRAEVAQARALLAIPVILVSHHRSRLSPLAG
jgi:hypothetical protein